MPKVIYPIIVRIMSAGMMAMVHFTMNKTIDSKGISDILYFQAFLF
jgi:hypothetical protein